MDRQRRLRAGVQPKILRQWRNIGLYVQSDTNVEGNIERIKRGMRDGYGGVENAHKIPVMPKGNKLEHTGVTHKDMDFATLAETTRDRILAGYRVSKTTGVAGELCRKDGEMVHGGG